MKTIINLDIMAENFPTKIEFHCLDDGFLVNVYKIYAGCDKSRGCDLIGLYHNSNGFREKINEEITDKYMRGDYES